jgi:NAD(P)-dependent dehydrogenase (short-subunit alcohol dehydrogenase family)
VIVKGKEEPSRGNFYLHRYEGDREIWKKIGPNAQDAVNAADFESTYLTARAKGIMARLTGEVAVITGGSSGIGLATAKKFVEEGAYAFITGRRESELEKAKATIGQNFTTVQGDVAKIEDLDRLYRTVEAEKGKVDIVMANAGFVELGTLNDSSVEHYDKTFGTNARGTFFTVQKALPLLREGASIILVSSCVQTKGIPQYGTYSATKASIRSFARSWTAELKDRNIRVKYAESGSNRHSYHRWSIQDRGRGGRGEEAVHHNDSTRPPWRSIRTCKCRVISGVKRQQLRHGH